MTEYIIFGFFDNFIMLLGAFTGISIEKKFFKKLPTGLMTIFGAGIGNAFSDGIAGILALNVPLGIGSFLGCLIGLFLIPIYAKFNNKGIDKLKTNQ
jgi:hypothetical protein